MKGASIGFPDIHDSASHAWFVFAVAFIGMVGGWGAWYSFGVFLNPLLMEFGWTRAMTTGCTVVFHLLYGLRSLLHGRLMDRCGPRVIIPVFGSLMGT